MARASNQQLVQYPPANVRWRASSIASSTRWLTRAIGAMSLTWCVAGAQDAAAQRALVGDDPSPHSEISLLSEHAVVRPGTRETVALRVTIDRGWHTYWTNAGDAGFPLAAEWTASNGASVSSLQFPTPRLLPQPPLMSYGYERELIVLADVSIPSTAVVGSTVRLTANADWLVCAEVCLPASGRVELALPVSPQGASLTPFATSIAATRGRLVQPAAGWKLNAWTTPDGYGLVAVVPHELAASLRAPYFLADSMLVVQHAAVQQVQVQGDTLRMAIVRSSFAKSPRQELSGVIVGDVATGVPGWHIDIAVAKRVATNTSLFAAGGATSTTGGAGATVHASAVAASDASIAGKSAAGAIDEQTGIVSLLLAMGAALLGGVILNLMPCVFPVLSVKILAFVERGGTDSREGKRHAMVFTAGVLSTFWALAGVLLLLRAGGTQLGWGFQLQSPAVVAVLALVLFALALNLSGVFTLGAGLTRLGAVGGGERYLDSFLTGLLAVIVATPCTAPFMGAALGFALTQPALSGMAVFTALGVGLALPYIVFASSPQLLRRLPRPGPWLETLKQLLAFPMYATVVWLVWVLGRQAGPDTIAIALLTMVVLALAGWWAGRAQMAGRSTSGVIGLAAVALSIVAGGVVVGVQPAEARTAVVPAGWEPYSAARVAEARAAQQAVFVDFTAAWCLSCQVNERVALHSDAVQQAFAKGNVLLLRADWTSRDPEITKALAEFGRSGVPLYVIYPASGNRPAELLPAVLTPGVVLAAIERAGGATTPVAARPTP